MKTKLLFFAVMALTLLGCRNNGPTGDEKLWSRYASITRSIENAYNYGSFDLDNFTVARLMNSGTLAGDSLYVSRVSENQFLLTTDKSTRSILNLTVDILNQGYFEDIKRDYYSVIVDGEGSYKLSEDSLFSYKLKNIGGEIIHGYPYYESEQDEWTALAYSNGGEIILTLNANGKQTTFHYDLTSGHIRCRETGRLVLSYDD